MKYTAEEVRARVNKAWQNHDEQGRVFITMGDAKALVETILPERIKVGVSDADVDAVIESVSHINTDGMDGDSWDRILVRAAFEHFTKGDRYE
jgi:nitrogen regulatory protein PII